MTRAKLILAVGLAALFSCSEKMPQEKPAAPDMSALVASYAHPDLTLDAQNMPATAEAYAGVASLVQKARDLVPSIDSALQTSANEAANPQSTQAQSPSLQPQAVSGEGFLQVHRICPGANPNAGPLEANGSLDLTVGFTEKGVDPVVWGTASSCQINLLGVLTTVTGSIKVFLGADGAAFNALKTTPMLFELKLELKVGDKVESLATDFRLDPSGGIEYRVFSGDRFALYWDDLKQRGYTAANGKFTCNFDQKQCLAENGTALSW